MPIENVRAGITQAKFNEDAWNFLGFELVIVSIFAGIYYSSWYIFAGVLLSLFVVLLIKPLAIILVIVLSGIWAFLGYQLASILSWGDGAGFVVGGLAFLTTLGMHIGAIEYARDLNDTDKDNSKSSSDDKM